MNDAPRSNECERKNVYVYMYMYLYEKLNLFCPKGPQLFNSMFINIQYACRFFCWPVECRAGSFSSVTLINRKPTLIASLISYSLVDLKFRTTWCMLAFLIKHRAANYFQPKY